MKQDIAKKWAAELRSKKWKQGVATLHNLHDNSYCCLGVLCEMAVEAGVCLPEVGDDGCTVYRDNPDYGRDTSCKICSDAIQKWAGLSAPVGGRFVLESHRGYEETSLAGMNDRGDSFEEIADVIELNADRL